MVIKENVTKQVVDYFLLEIRNENWKVGDKIPSENELTEILGCSRSSVRSALKQFAGVGILESIQGKGTFLRGDDLSVFGLSGKAPTIEDYNEMLRIMEFRHVVEPECCYLAVTKLQEDTVHNLDQYLKKMQQSIGDRKEYVEADLRFHEEIINSTKNPLLISALKDVYANKMQSFQLFNEVYGYMDGIYFHDLILKAFKEKDPKKAKRIMRNHLQKAIDDLEESKNQIVLKVKET